MTRLPLAFLFALSLCACSYAADFVPLDEAHTFYVQTLDPDTSYPADADFAPTYRIYENGVYMSLSGSTVLNDAANTNGWYKLDLTPTAVAGFELGKSYQIRYYVEVGGEPGEPTHDFRCDAAVSSRSSHSVADIRADVERSGGMLQTTQGYASTAATESSLAKTSAAAAASTLGTPAGASIAADIAAVDAGASQVTADRVAKQVTFTVGSEGTESRNIVKLNAWSTGTRTLGYDFTELLKQMDTTLSTVDTVTVVQSDGSPSITTSSLRKHQNGMVALWNTAAITTANAGTYVVTVTVTTTDSNTVVVTGTLEVE